MHRPSRVLLAVLIGLAQGCSRHGTGASATGTSAPTSSVSPPLLGPDRPSICRATESPDAAGDKWARFGDIIPIFHGGWLYVLEGRASDAEAAIAPFNLRGTIAIECSPHRVVLWLQSVDLRNGGGGVEYFNQTLSRGGLVVEDAVEFPIGESNRWRQRVCQDPAACCRLLQLNCRFQATSELDVHACVRDGKQYKAVQVDPSCQ